MRDNLGRNARLVSVGPGDDFKILTVEGDKALSEVREKGGPIFTCRSGNLSSKHTSSRSSTGYA
ncbi:unnamed protein product [Prunus armeniaca]